MAEKITFEQFFQAVDPENHIFVHELHSYLLDKGCKVAFEAKKSGHLASYKYGKPVKTVLNFVFRKNGMLTRIYGEHIAAYSGFLDTLPEEMLQHLHSAGDCKRITQNTCSPKCRGYEFTIGDSLFQKCRYNCFEFLMTDISRPFIRSFIAHELAERMKPQ